ncbi:MAG: hypothetical protein ACOX5R_19650 [bacterium]|jgi:hypothetical protein
MISIIAVPSTLALIEALKPDTLLIEKLAGRSPLALLVSQPLTPGQITPTFTPLPVCVTPADKPMAEADSINTEPAKAEFQEEGVLPVEVDESGSGSLLCTAEASHAQITTAKK